MIGKLNEPENPCPLGMVRVQRLCHVNDSLILHTTPVVPTTSVKGKNNEPLQKTTAESCPCDCDDTSGTISFRFLRHSKGMDSNPCIQHIKRHQEKTLRQTHPIPGVDSIPSPVGVGSLWDPLTARMNHTLGNPDQPGMNRGGFFFPPASETMSGPNAIVT
jgi:hypothetical protein